MKFLVETKDNLQVVGNGEEMHARYNRPSVVRDNTFMQQHIAAGTVQIKARLVDEATDAEYEDRWLAAHKDAKTADDKEAATEKVTDKFLAEFEFSDKPKKGKDEQPPPPKA
ncbi:hypothetical protein CPT_Seuss14 [Caulobacter phage Seuss]|uniref:Uncharacterized protein n=1 Tax=Caulobacter phage Seuss TaxID=1675601 RepID=A0A0K1LN29_9CAUD|nr:hypothetical protein HOR08_gp014 [Caulobacter phage Seuss]AKU43540.1 hypothetical protein CPT_Seuss14 [Caulobacter phage Seuss]